ncbi:MAG: UDP-glucose 4-epimerase GalE [Firmicutes bacterium]|nr:UDP-glucose 4-epimerase GalE [Bacillota bacterium]
MKVCVIGGAGYIGSHAVYELIRDGHEVVVIDNLSTGKKEMVHKDAKFYLGDITIAENLKEIFKQECEIKPFDVVMHFAAKLIVPESVEQPLEYYYNNVEGVRIMLSVMKDFNIKNVVFSSTAAVYGEPEKEICEETDRTNPINPYGETKLASEKLIKWVCERYNMNYCIFRYFNVAGADESLEIGLNKDNLTHIVPVTVQTALGIRDKMIVFGNDYDTKDGTCVRDYIHVSDLAYAHVLGAKYLVNNNKSLLVNLGSNEGYSVLEIIKEVEKYYKVNYEIGERRAGDPAKLIASNNKAKELLGWTPKRNLSDIIKSDINYRIKIKD